MTCRGAEKLGLRLNAFDDKHDFATIGEIHEGQAFAKYNAASPSNRVEVGDHIMMVNGVVGARNGCKAMEKELYQSKQLKLELMRKRSQVALPPVAPFSERTRPRLAWSTTVERRCAAPPGARAGAAPPRSRCAAPPGARSGADRTAQPLRRCLSIPWSAPARPAARAGSRARLA